MNSANEVVQNQLRDHLLRIEEALSGDVILFCGPIAFGVDEIIRDAVERLVEGSSAGRRDKIGFLLETTGGYIEVAQRIADTLRKHYDIVEFIVPNYAYSAGTVLVMSGDAIHMDYFSVLGPIDPQLPRRDGSMVPALGYLKQYERLIEKSQAGKLSTAEMAFLLQKFDPGELYAYEQARDLSISLLKEWLVKYKFKNWVKTETRKKKVTPHMRVARAEQIAKQLNEIHRWNSHGRGISMETLRRDLNLVIEDFGTNAALNSGIRTYYKLLKSFMETVQQRHVVHTKFQYIPLGGAA